MKKFSLFLLLLIGSCSIATAQTYNSGTTPQQNVTSFGQTFTFSFTNVPLGGWGNAQLVVYYSGDFGYYTAYADVTDEDANNLGQAGPYASGNSCDGLDSVILNFDATLIDNWMSDSQVDFTITTTNDVDPGNCSESFLQCKLIYNYCTFGVPQAIAATALTQNIFCKNDNPITLTGTPAGGTWSGPGVSGNMFDPGSLNPGDRVMITYTTTDGIGCITSADTMIRIKQAPEVSNTFACPGATADLSTSNGGAYVWFSDQALTQVIDTNTMITTPALNQTTNYYVASLYTTSSFVIDSIAVTDSMIVDIDNYAGDDRGGIAITPDYIYMVGDNNTVRADAADLANRTSLPIRDGIFSDLGTGNLCTLWNTDQNESPNDNNPQIPVNAIRGMDADLNYTWTVPLDMEIPLDYGSIVLSGNGFLGIISAADGHAYVVDLDDYSVSDIGAVSGIQNYGSENWADWGVLEYDGVDFYAAYSDQNTDIVRHNLTTNAETTVMSFPSQLSDMASFTVSPWNNRFYFHYEGNSSVFGGNYETLGFSDAGTSTVLIENNALGCYTEVEVAVSDINLGADTTACINNAPVMLFAGNGFESYTWNGVNNNYNVFAAMQSGQYIVDAVDSHNCTISDTIVVTLDECLGLEEQELFSQVELYPNPAHDNATLKVTSASAIAGQCFIMDLNGNILFSTEMALAAGENTLNIQTDAFAPGIYLVRLADGNGLSSTIRLVKN